MALVSLEHVFPGDSHMAQRMRELDWSATALGPVEHWPDALRTSVSTCLNCAFPIFVWWGPELVMLYNDEYRAVLGPVKDPIALGKRGAEVWAEIWEVIGPMLSQVLERGEATRSRDLLLHVDRGYPEEAYFSFSYSPIYDESGKVGGVFCPVIETTEKVIGERRLRTLRDLAARCKGAESEAAAYDAAAKVFAENPHDVPFSMIYRIEGDVGRLDATAGIEPGAPAAPLTVSIDDDKPSIWSLAEVARSGKAVVVGDLASRFDALPTGAWKVPPQKAMVLPVQLPGQERPRAILVAGVSPMRALDDDHRTFFSLIATQIALGLADAEAREEERRRVAALAEIDRAKTAFFSNISHEFRTPLTLMLGPEEDALASTEGTLRGEALQTVHRNTLRLLKLVNSLLNFSRIEAGRAQASYEATDLAAWTKDLASAFQSAIERGGLRFEVECSPLPEQVFVDRDMWENIVLNLLSNAFKFTFEGTIGVRLHSVGGFVELEVQDSGVGISAQDLPHVFERFHRIEGPRARTHEGSGIGLALVHELVRLHGGSIRVASELGVGTTFTVSIPLGNSHLPAEHIRGARPLANAAARAEPFVQEALRWAPGSQDYDSALTEGGNGKTVPPSGAGSGARILVADDNADMRDYISRLLRQHWIVETASDGKEALELARKSPPDLVLTDVMMPNLGGFGLLQGLRRDPLTANIPVIMLSARAGDESRVEGLEAGADDYLVKPFSAKEVIARVNVHLENARLRGEAEKARSLAEAANVTKDEFLAMLGHEMRNPLAPILTSLQLMRMRGLDGREQAIIERQVDNLVRLVDDLLDISRITSGKVELKKDRLELAQAVIGGLELASPLLESRHQHVDLQVPTEGLEVLGDPGRLAQVVSNLVSNAAKYSGQGTTVHITATRAGEFVRLRVRDEGIGLESDMINRVFEAFVQQPQSLERSKGGLGLGLAIVKSLVELHGGSVAAVSEGLGKGSEFIVDLPLASDAPALRQAHPAEEAPVAALRFREKTRILVVDDNPDVADTLSDILNELGYDVAVAYDGPSALQVVKSFRPNVCLVDIGLPVMDGYELAHHLRESGDLAEGARIVAVSGYGQDADRRRSIEAGFSAHLVKPVNLDLLTSTILN